MSAVPVILVAEDDPDDRLLLQQAWKRCGVEAQLRFVDDGELLLDYLLRRGIYTDPARAPKPVLVLVDLKMPRKDGLSALAEIKAHPALRRIPVAVQTSSRSDRDVLAAWDLGAAAYYAKPVRFEDLLALVKTIADHWLGAVELPGAHELI